jgi:hypothetical protein
MPQPGGRRTGEFNQALVVAQTEITLLKKRVERLEAELAAVKALLEKSSTNAPIVKQPSVGPPPLPKAASSKALGRRSVVDISEMAELLDEGARISVLPPKPRGKSIPPSIPGPPRPRRP